MEQILANGLYLGAQYALIALGLTLIFSLMNVLNFAHGQMYVFGGFVTYTVVAQWGLPFIVGLIASAIILAIMGALIEFLLFRPVIRKSKRDESTMLLAAGIAFFLDAVILLLFGEKQRGVPKIVNGIFNWDMRLIMPYDRILIGVLAIAMIAGFIALMQYTKAGRAIPAGRPGGRAFGHHHRHQPGHGRPDIGQGLHYDHDRRGRGDFGCHRGRLHPWDDGKHRPDRFGGLR